MAFTDIPNADIDSNSPLDVDLFTAIRDNLNYLFFPTGAVIMYAGTPGSVPLGWLICDGSAVSRASYANLFTAIGVAYGTGDGSTTFNLPDLRGRSPLGTNDAGLPNGANGSFSTRNEGASGGEESHALITAEMPTHTHSERGRVGTGSSGGIVAFVDADNQLTTFTADQTAAAGSGTAHNNMHPYQVVNFMIKSE